MANLSVLNQIKNYVDQNAGFTNPNAGTALAAVAGAESGGNPSAINPSSGAVGLFQDLGARKDNLLSFLQSGGSDLSGVEGQTQNAINELHSGQYAPSLSILNDPNASLSDTEKALIQNFERPDAAGAAQDFAQASALNSQISGDGSGALTQSVNDAGSNPVEDFGTLSSSGAPAVTFGMSTSSQTGQGASPATGETIPQAIDKQTAGLASDTSATNTTNIGLVASGETFGVNILQRVGVILLGIVFVAGGIYFLKSSPAIA